MPYKSQAQAGYFHTHKAELESQGVNVGEWDRATKGKHLPQHLAEGGTVYAKGSAPKDTDYAKGGASLPGGMTGPRRALRSAASTAAFWAPRTASSGTTSTRTPSRTRLRTSS